LVEDGEFTTRVHKDGGLSTANGAQAFRAAKPDRSVTLVSGN
jgi:hypothetical protein